MSTKIRNLAWAIAGFTIGLVLVGSTVHAATILFGYQGGTGYGPTTTASNVGKFLRVASSTPYLTYDFASALTATPTLQQVSDQGSVTTNALTFAGGTSTAGLVVQGLLTAPTGSFTYTDATTTNATFATVGTLTASNATITNVSTTNLTATNSIFQNATSTNLAVTGSITGASLNLSGALTVSGVSTLATTTVTNFTATRTSTLATTTITNLSVSGASTLTGNTTVGGTLGVTGNTTLSGTLGVTGASTLTTTTVTNFTASNTSTLATTTITNLTVSGATTLNTPLPLASGGTNASLTASNGGIVYSNGTALAILAGTATAGQIPRSGANAAPSWSTATYPATAGTAGKIMRSDGTNFLSSTSLWPDTTTINQILYSSSANTIAGITTANNGVLITSAGGVPSIGSTLPSAVQGNITSVGTLTSLTVSGASSLATTTVTNFTASRTSTLATTSITSLSLSSPLTVANGGTGASSLTANGVLLGNGTSAVAVTATGTANQVLTSNGGATAPTFQAIPGATNGMSTLSGSVSISSTSFLDTGLSVTLPSAGTYLVMAQVRAFLYVNTGAPAQITTRFYNSTDSSAITNSEVIVVLAAQNFLSYINTAPMMQLITVTGSKTIKLQAQTVGGTTFTTRDIQGDSSGYTNMIYVKVSN